MHLGQIFVSPDDPTTIQGIVDWQSTQVGPLFVQALFQEFLRQPKGYKQGFDTPKLPDNYESWIPSKRKKPKRTIYRHSKSKYYEMTCISHNKPAYNGTSLDRALYEPFTPYMLSYGSLVLVRKCLGRLAQNWDDLDLPGICPFSFTEEGLKRQNEEAEQYEAISGLWDMVKTVLYTNGDCWVPKSRWEATIEMNKELYDKFIECLDQETPNEAEKMYQK